jgi:hypothetical protein
MSVSNLEAQVLKLIIACKLRPVGLKGEDFYFSLFYYQHTIVVRGHSVIITFVLTVCLS